MGCLAALGKFVVIQVTPSGGVPSFLRATNDPKTCVVEWDMSALATIGAAVACCANALGYFVHKVAMSQTTADGHSELEVAVPTRWRPRNPSVWRQEVYSISYQESN